MLLLLKIHVHNISKTILSIYHLTFYNNDLILLSKFNN